MSNLIGVLLHPAKARRHKTLGHLACQLKSSENSVEVLQNQGTVVNERLK